MANAGIGYADSCEPPAGEPPAGEIVVSGPTIARLDGTVPPTVSVPANPTAIGPFGVAYGDGDPHRWGDPRFHAANGLSDEPESEPYRIFVYPMQRRFLDSEKTYRGFFAGRGAGKALSLDTLLPTPDGWTSMGDVRVGDQLFDENGCICNVVGKTNVMTERPCYEVVFSDGERIVADAEHEWLTTNRRTRKAIGRRKVGVNKSNLPQCQIRFNPEIVTTKQISQTIYDGKEINHSIEVCKPIELPEKDLPIPPYTFGAWLGDGTSINANIKFISRLHSLGIAEKKHIPSIYLRASVFQRFELLKGLMDTDGYVNNGRCEITSVNSELAVNIRELCVSLGIKPTISEGIAKLDGRVIGPKYRIAFTSYSPVFKLRRKLEKQKPAGLQSKRQLRRYIIAVNPVESVPVCCIQVDSLSHMYLAGTSMIPTHNSFVGAYDLISRAMRKTNRLYMVVGRTFKVMRDTSLRTFLSMAKKIGILEDFNKTDFRAYIKGGNEVVFRSADEPDSLRGPNTSGLWIDEASYCAEEAFKIAIGCLREKGEQGWCTSTSTPNGRKHWTYKTFGCGNPIHTELFQCKTADNPFLPDNFAETLRSQHTSAKASQELDGDFIDNDGTMFHRAWFNNHRVAAIPYGSRRVRYWDKASTKDGGCYTCGALLAEGPDRRYYIENLVRGQWNTFEREETILRTTEKDAIKYGMGMVRNFVEQEPGSGGKDSAVNTVRMLAGHIIYADNVSRSGDKRTRAEPLAAQLGGGNVWTLDDDTTVAWYEDLVDEACLFPSGPYCDSVDACSGAFNKLRQGAPASAAVGGGTSGSGVGMGASSGGALPATSAGPAASGLRSAAGSLMHGMPAAGMQNQQQGGLRNFRPR